ncbi:MAG: phosphomethylpyrimidine synthase ThiC, partial [Candidatus Omnitrophica bacterium]|nr:phosphomethylpyrimidine synthase ThiC [Candidatus Omnitrophota bacterium]
MFKKSFLKNIAKKEKVSLSFLEKQLKDKKAVIPLNNQKELKNPVVIGDGFKVKINTNIGISSEKPDISGEIKKLKEAIRCGSDTVMDLSIGKNPSLLRKQIIKKSIIPLGTVPIYEAAVNAEKKNGSFEQMPFDCIWETLKKQAQEGVDFFTIHSG